MYDFAQFAKFTSFCSGPEPAHGYQLPNLIPGPGRPPCRNANIKIQKKIKIDLDKEISLKKFNLERNTFVK